ncbi:hypothetical protein PENSPDRAFT_690453 [Peniophora sp. CONT]|nr:hypothetical protein PENSPDRAFT_690453 [Peniophora sp. CONT]
MSRRHSDIGGDSSATRLKRMMVDPHILQEYRDQLSTLAATDTVSDDVREAQDISKFSDFAACQELSLCTRKAPDSPVFFGYETESGPKEMLFYDVGFVKNTFFPPVPERRFKAPGALYHSISLVAPPGETRMNLVSTAIQNLFFRMSTSSSSRKFAGYSVRPWTSDTQHGEQAELFLTSRVLTYSEDISSGRVASKACSIPSTFDVNGRIQRMVDSSKGSLCFTSDNLFRVCDVTVPSHAPRSNRFPSPDAVVSGQLVYVTFALHGSIAKPAGVKVGSRDGQWKYTFTPTLKSLLVLSKSGPVTMMRQAMLKPPKAPVPDNVMQDALPEPDEQDISRELKKLRIGPPAQ